ncbi:MAG: hypothetical protein ACYS8I_06695, partial [Planctomycetota bacterium]
MAVFVTNEQSTAGASVSSITHSSYNADAGVRENRVLVVCVSCENASTAPTIDDVTFNAVSLTKAVGVLSTVSGNDLRSEIWYMAGASGTADIVATFSASVTDGNVQAFILDGAVEQAPEATNSATDTSSPIGPDSITTITGGAMVISYMATSVTTAVTESETNQVGIASDNVVNYRDASSSRQAGDAGSHTMGWTQTGTVQAAHVLTAWEDAGAWISNFVSALTQGNEDAAAIT